MNELDRKIRDALRAQDAEIFGDFSEEPSMLEMVMETFQGKHRWLILLTMSWTLVFFALAILSGVSFFRAEATRDLLMWAVACILCVSAVSMLKMWFWMELNKNSVTREIKRLELQIARLAGRMQG